MEKSVHLENFPKLDYISVNEEIVKKMDEVREICNCVLSLRKEVNIRVRMPLKKITICGKSDLNDDYLDLIKQETNVKQIELFEDNLNKIATQEVVLNMKECGKIFGSNLKDILIAQKQHNWEIVDGNLMIAGFKIEKELYEVVYKSKDGAKISSCDHFNLLVMIDTEQTEDLIIEGLSRDIVRVIQQKRKENGYEISDRINVEINTNDEIFNKVLDNWEDYICEQTLATKIEINTNVNKNEINEVDGHKFSFLISKN